jgi:hypothetical protein
VLTVTVKCLCPSETRWMSQLGRRLAVVALKPEKVGLHAPVCSDVPVCTLWVYVYPRS